MRFCVESSVAKSNIPSEEFPMGECCNRLAQEKGKDPGNLRVTRPSACFWYKATGWQSAAVAKASISRLEGRRTS